MYYSDRNDNKKETIVSVDFAPEMVKVANCSSVNLRNKPVVNPHNIIEILPVGTELKVDQSFKHQIFYKVETEDSKIGYVMKEFTK